MKKIRCSIETDEFGCCMTQRRALDYLNQQGISVGIQRGVLTFQYPGQPPRRVFALSIHNHGWFYPLDELRRDYARPRPEPTPEPA